MANVSFLHCSHSMKISVLTALCFAVVLHISSAKFTRQEPKISDRLSDQTFTEERAQTSAAINAGLCEIHAQSLVLYVVN